MKFTLEQAIAGLDPTVDDHWTLDGLPRLDVLSEATGLQVRRKDVTAAAPELTRATAPTFAEGDDDEPGAPAEAEEELEDEPEEEVTPANPDEPDPELEKAAEKVIEKLADAELERERTQEEIDDELLGLDMRSVLSDYRLCEASLEALNRRNIAAVRKKSQADEELKQLHAKITIAESALKKLEAAKPSIKREAGTRVQAYLRSQRDARMERARRIQRFHDLGVTPKAVAASMQGAPIDVALSTRTTGRGRPKPIVPKRLRQAAGA